MIGLDTSTLLLDMESKSLGCSATFLIGVMALHRWKDCEGAVFIVLGRGIVYVCWGLFHAAWIRVHCDTVCSGMFKGDFGS